MTNRRAFLTTLASTVAGSAIARDYTPGAPSARYPDPDVIALEDAFKPYIQGNAPIQRLFTGCLWAEGPAWSTHGNYLMWSDIPNNRQMRWLNEDGHVSTLRSPSNYSNGNTFDFEGRQISCEHGTRRVLRYERDGKTTVLAEKFEGKPFNAPNDAVVHPDGGIWFTDPGYGSMTDYEGFKGELQIKEAVYRIATDGTIAKVCDDAVKPNGLCFSPDYKKLYVVDTGDPKNLLVYDVIDQVKLGPVKEFAVMNESMERSLGDKVKRFHSLGSEIAKLSPSQDREKRQALTEERDKLQAVFNTWTKKNSPFAKGGQGGSDGVRCDIDGNVWASSGWVGEGYDGVHIFAPDGSRIGLIRLPETGSNLCFGGPRRNRLFVTASQSLYSVYVNTRGAHIC